MVFGGRPSPGCKECRKRKIKCDQSRPGCMRCTKTGWQCSGYRNQLDLKFHDESEEVVRRARNRKDGDSTATGSVSIAAMRRSSSPITPMFIAISTPETVATLYDFSCESIPRMLWQPVEVLARNHFMKNWVTVSATYDYTPILDAFPPFDPGTRDAYSEVRDSLGMVSLSYEHGAPEMMDRAVEKYAVALESLNITLRNNKEADENRTLLAILLMIVFEVVTTLGEELNPWWHHVRGYIALLKARRPRHNEDWKFIRMFYTLRTLALMGCLLRVEAVPDVLVSLSEAVMEFTKQSLPALIRPETNLFFILTRLCDLRDRIKNGSIFVKQEIISNAEEVDAALAVWARYLPERFAYTTCFRTDETPSDHFLRGSYHIYTDCVVALHWNMYRAGRVITNALMLQYTTDEPHHRPSRETYKSNQRRMTEDICASVPFMLDFDIVQREPASKPRTAGACFLIVPLMIITAWTDSVLVREFVMQRLKYIGIECGVKRAYILYETLNNQRPRHWK